MRNSQCLPISSLILTLVLFFVSCTLLAGKIELKNSGDCPPDLSNGNRFIIEGYFGINQEEGVPTNAGYEGHPFAKFAFCNQPGGDCNFRVTLVMAGDGNNSSDVSNKTYYNNSTHPHYHIYDNQGQEIDFNK